jgi:hypothetical protein
MGTPRNVVAMAAVIGALVACSRLPPDDGSYDAIVAGKNDDDDDDEGDESAAAAPGKSGGEATTEDRRSVPDPAPKGNETVTDGGPSGGEAGGADAGTPTFPRKATTDECKHGDGTYCGGDGVDGASGTLYRCKDRTITVQKKCRTACLFFASNVDDACDGDVGYCPYGNGLYCTGSGLAGEPKTLYSCEYGKVTQKQVCATKCVKESAGVDDHCGG